MIFAEGCLRVFSLTLLCYIIETFKRYAAKGRKTFVYVYHAIYSRITWTVAPSTVLCRLCLYSMEPSICVYVFHYVRRQRVCLNNIQYGWLCGVLGRTQQSHPPTQSHPAQSHQPVPGCGWNNRTQPTSQPTAHTHLFSSRYVCGLRRRRYALSTRRNLRSFNTLLCATRFAFCVFRVCISLARMHNTFLPYAYEYVEYFISINHVGECAS